MDTEYESSRIERAKRGLYSSGKEEGPAEYRQELTPSPIEVGTDWGETTIVREHVVKKGAGIFLLKLLVAFAVLTTFTSGGYLLYQIFDPFSKPSDKNIIISFDLPVGITPGVPADITVKVNNQNRIPLEYANLSLIYPSGTRDGGDSNKDLRDQKKVLGEIAAGQEVSFQTKAIFLGEENTDKELRALLEFRFKNINSVFTKEEVRPVHVTASPVNLSVDTLKEVNSGQDISLSINALSNTVIPLRDVLIKVEYPLGFTYADADPKPTFGNNIWRIGVMTPASKLNIKVKGVLVGEDTQERVFHTTVGVGGDQSARDVSVSYGKVLSSVILQRPFIGITLLMNNKKAEDATAEFGRKVEGVVQWTNNLSTKIINAQIEVHFSGVALDRATLHSSQGGFFRSSDNTIFWDERGNPVLAELEAGESGSVGFTFYPMPSVTGNKVLTNPVITADVTVRGKRLSESGVPEEIKTEIAQDVKVTSQAQMTSRVVHFVGPITNRGPMPPKVDQETTYTVIWDIVNTSNTINDPVVKAIIPPYVSWGGAVYPNTENVTYDKSTNQITWLPGNIVAGTGVNTAPREASFQIIFTPSLSQLKSSPMLLNKTTFSGTDSFTGQTVSQEKTDLSTVLSTDPKAVQDDSVVVP